VADFDPRDDAQARGLGTERRLEPTFFATAGDFRAWLEEHHADARELWVGFYKKSSGKPSITWPEAVDQALCFGWIDGVRKGIDDVAYANRFTPRTAKSTWSAINIERVEELKRRGLMHPAGLEAYAKRAEERSGVYSYEQRQAAKLDPAYERRFRANEKAWDFFQTQPAWYRRAAVWWVVSAKKEETRLRRLTTLIDDSEHRRAIRPLTRPAKRG
jgi:uncharacterized protein YdeI (YjbR/CyaY-like superfamily)